MKLLRYGPRGQEKPGMLDADGTIRDLSGVIDDVAGDAISPQGLARLAAIDPASLPVVSGNPRIGTCVGRVGKIVAIGLNYADHAAESNLPIPAEPIMFFKATSALNGPDDDVLVPPGSKKTDWEVELGIIIGSHTSRVSEDAALDHVAGFCVVNDVSEREWQIERGGQWVKGKSADTFAPVGPWLVTHDEVPDPQNLHLWLEIDGKMRQNGSTSTMIFGVKMLVSYVSQFMSLQPGDIITTGTPPGVGMGVKPEPVYLKGGETMRVGIDGLGTQTQNVRAL